MSERGMKMFAESLSHLQETRLLLIKLGCEKPNLKSGKQDILLGQLLEKAKDAVKSDFCKITMEKE